MSTETKNRAEIITRTSLIGIGANVILAAFKVVIGLGSHSIGVMLDAVNNISDALSSVVTVIGTKLAGRKPDKKHPLGYGRVEYLSAMVVSGVVLYAGITSTVESVKKIIRPEKAEYSVVSLAVLASAIVVKILLGRYVRRKGIEVGSAALSASASEALFDAGLSFSVLVSALIYMTKGIMLEAYVGVVISVMLIKSGFEMMTGTLDDILGKRTDADFARAIKATICEDREVLGAFDLYLYNYGPGQDYGSVHVEILNMLSADEIDAMNRRIQAAVYAKHNVLLTGIGIYSVNRENDVISSMRRTVLETVMAHDYSLQFHGFYVDVENKFMAFDVVLSFDYDQTEALRQLYREIGDLYPDYRLSITPDVDITE